MPSGARYSRFFTDRESKRAANALPGECPSRGPTPPRRGLRRRPWPKPEPRQGSGPGGSGSRFRKRRLPGFRPPPGKSGRPRSGPIRPIGPPSGGKGFPTPQSPGHPGWRQEAVRPGHLLHLLPGQGPKLEPQPGYVAGNFENPPPREEKSSRCRMASLFPLQLQPSRKGRQVGQIGCRLPPPRATLNVRPKEEPILVLDELCFQVQAPGQG